MTEEKSSGVQIKQKQEEQNTEAHIKTEWFALEAKSFHAPIPLTRFKRLRLKISNYLLDVKGGIKQDLVHEVETGLGFNFLPVFLSFGILIYFAIPAEPSIYALTLTPLVLLGLALKLEFQTKLYYFLLSLVAIFAGMFFAQLATLLNQTRIIERQTTTQLEGVVLGVDQSRRGAARYFIRPTSLDGLDKAKLPKRIRASSAAKNKEILPGETITGLVRLQPVSGPVYPGGYDFSFFAWHEGMGASGFFMGRPSKSDIKHDLAIGEKFIIQINKIRLSVEKRILKAMPDATGKIAVALVTGNKTYIPSDVQDSLRKTGLAHILAISGLHMALVTLTVIWCIRLGLAFLPKLVLRYPIKKWAVCAGFASATGYLMLSGAGVATQRAWVMISVMLLAVLMDKRAITMRSVAISAVIILVINPQSLLSPGFQMSFAAVTSLVAGYEFLNKKRKAQAENIFTPVSQNLFARASSGALGYFTGIATTSLIAGTATVFIAAWHFHQVAPYGLLANLMAMPIVSILIMPFVLFSILLMPYGLEFIPLKPVSIGIDWVVDISRWVEGISPNGNTGLLPGITILIFASFLILICLLKTKLRYASLMPLLALPFMLQTPTKPDVLISENGRAVAIKTDGEKIGLLFPRGSAFVQNIWLKAWSGGEQHALNLPKDQCNRERCIVILPSSKILHVLYNPDFIQSSCNRADILVTPRLWWVNCKDRQPELVLNRYDFERFGTHALYIKKVMPKARIENKILNSEISPQSIMVETSLPKASRPWHRNVTHPDDAKKLW